MGLREEDGKLFFLLPEELREDSYWSHADKYYGYNVRNHGWEIPLCDYNCSVGESFLSFVGFWIEELTVQEVQEVEICGKKRKGFGLDNGSYYLDGNLPSIIEGIGIVSGLPYGLQEHLMTTKPPLKVSGMRMPYYDWWPFPSGMPYRLYRIEDENDNILFEDNPLFKVITGLESLEGENTSMDHTVYDLHGQRVSTPQPGGVYIRDGKKFVWPR